MVVAATKVAAQVLLVVVHQDRVQVAAEVLIIMEVNNLILLVKIQEKVT